MRIYRGCLERDEEMEWKWLGTPCGVALLQKIYRDLFTYDSP